MEMIVGDEARTLVGRVLGRQWLSSVSHVTIERASDAKRAAFASLNVGDKITFHLTGSPIASEFIASWS